MIDLNNIFSCEAIVPNETINLQPIKPVSHFNKPTNELILAVDFDGTIVTDSFPKIGSPIPDAIESLKLLQKYGVHIILWTCRDGEYLKQALKFLSDNGIIPEAANDNSPIINFKPSKKIYGDWYLDDRSFPGFPGWNIFIETFKKVYGVQ